MTEGVGWAGEHENTQIDGEFDENGRLIVSETRDKPPIGQECASAIFFDIDRKSGILKTVGVRNIASYKPKSFTLPGGTKKGRRKGTKTAEMESPPETVCNEAEEEAGVRHLDGSRLTEDDFYPVLCGNVHDEPIRDSEGEPVMALVRTRDGSKKMVQVRGVIPHFVFARFGPIRLHETTDKKTKEPRTFTLDQIMQSENNHNWSPKHVVFQIQTLRFLGEGLVAYRKGEMNDKRDTFFYQNLWECALSSTERYWTIHDWMEENTINGVMLDSHFALYKLFNSELKTKSYLHPPGVNMKFEFFPRLNAGHFDLEKSKDENFKDGDSPAVVKK